LSVKLDLSTISNTGAETFASGVNKTKSLQSAIALAKAALFAHPDTLTSQADRLGVKQGALSYEEFVDKTARAYAKDIYAMKAKDARSGILSGSGKNPEQQKRAGDWLKVVYGENMVQAQQALDLLRGIDYGQGLTIDRAEIVQKGPNDNNRYVTFDLKGDIKSKFTKEELADAFGIDPKAITEKGPAKDLQSGQYEQTIEVRVSPTNANFLQSFYNDAEKSKRVWQGVENLPQYVPAQDVETILQGRKVDIMFPDQVQKPKITTYKY